MTDLEGRNLFYQKDRDYNLTSEARQFIGGILKYARETSIIMASTFNSYKAYIFGKEAPIIRGWGLQNRSSMIRVPDNTDSQNTRIELRNPDPGGNVYLQIATFIGMGLKGIQEKLDCDKPDTGNNYNTKYNARLWDERFLPRSMYEAMVEAERSRFLRDLLGDLLYKEFIALKKAEWEEHRIYISAKEHKDYLRI
jgi:glutamine synthetase